MIERTKTTLIHGGHRGTEAAFGRCAETNGISEVTLSFEGHQMDRGVNVEMLSEEELQAGDVSMAIVFERLGRRFSRGKGIRRVIQSMFHLVSRCDELYAVGFLQDDDTVKGGTGWGVELAKFFHRPVFVFDQDSHRWIRWTGQEWEEHLPVLADATIGATGTRRLNDEGERAIVNLFNRSLEAAPLAK